MRDTGSVFPAERAAHFQRFGKVADFVQGTGMGLTSVSAGGYKWGWAHQVGLKKSEGTPFISNFRWPTVYYMRHIQKRWTL